MKIGTKEIIITRKQVRNAILVLGFVGAIGWAIYATITGADPNANPIKDVIETIDSAATTLPDTIIK